MKRYTWGEVKPRCRYDYSRPTRRPDKGEVSAVDGWCFWARTPRSDTWMHPEDFASIEENLPDFRSPRALFSAHVLCRAKHQSRSNRIRSSRRALMAKEAAEDRRRKARVRWAKYKRDRPLTILCARVRTRLAAAFAKGGVKRPGKTTKMLGCDWSFYMAYISARMRPGMTWENQGKVWHIDHVIPFSTARTPRELAKLCHYTNTQPLFALENIIKNDRVEYQDELKIA